VTAIDEEIAEDVELHRDDIFNDGPAEVDLRHCSESFNDGPVPFVENFPRPIEIEEPEPFLVGVRAAPRVAPVIKIEAGIEDGDAYAPPTTPMAVKSAAMLWVHPFNRLLPSVGPDFEVQFDERYRSLQWFMKECETFSPLAAKIAAAPCEQKVLREIWGEMNDSDRQQALQVAEEHGTTLRDLSFEVVKLALAVAVNPPLPF
jgi:hypothetical protein